MAWARSTAKNHAEAAGGALGASEWRGSGLGRRWVFGRTPKALLASLAVLALTGCSPGSYPADFFPEMHYQPNHRPLRPERLSPASDAVPVSGERVHYTLDEARTLQNPVHDASRAPRLFAVNCVPCHGQDGHGDGPVAKYFKEAAPEPPTDLSSARVRQRTDGELYWIVANGEGNMPAFGDVLTDQELWTVVLAIRDKQT